MEIPKNIKDEIWEYCRLNDITDIDSFILNSLQQGFNIDKYGSTPFKINQKEPEVVFNEVEKIVEVPVEKIVEVIKEVEKVVEKIVEVPIVKIVEKEVYISDDSQVEELREKLIQSQKDTSKYLSSWEDGLIELGDMKVRLNDYNKLLEKITEYEKVISDMGQLNETEQIMILTNEIENLKIELELEKNRHLIPKKKEQTVDEKPKRGGLGSIIKWISKDERDANDIYGE